MNPSKPDLKSLLCEALERPPGPERLAYLDGACRGDMYSSVPITQYCDRNGLTPKERLELFIPVCQTIQHAH